MVTFTAEQVLRSHRLRVTASRLAVLGAIDELGGHPDALAIATAVRGSLGSVSTQAVYDILRTYTELGILRRIEPAGHPARYERRVGDNHHHLVCRACGSAEDVDCVVGPAPCLDPVDARGFAIDEAEVIFWGLCPACRAPAARRPAASSAA